MPALPIDTDQIVITASRAPQPEAQTPASVTDHRPADGSTGSASRSSPRLLRLTPSAAVASIGPAGIADRGPHPRRRGQPHLVLPRRDQDQRSRPPAISPRFELLNADLASRIEVVRGPQSALWGSDAIGGVIAVNGLDDAPGYAAERRSRLVRLSPRQCAPERSTPATASLSGAVGWQRATGIDSFGAPGGDKDGYRNLSGRVRGTFALGSDVRARRLRLSR